MPGARQEMEPMTSNPTLPDRPSVEPSPLSEAGASFSGSTGAPGRLRVGMTIMGAGLLIIAAAATSLAASPTPSSSTGGSTTGPNAGGGVGPFGGGLGLFGLGRGHDDGDRMGRLGLRDVSITAIDGAAVTLGTPDGWHRTITISGSVSLTKGGQAIALADLKVGDQVVFRQQRTSDGSYTVTALAVVVPSIHGTASAISPTGFKVTTRDGSVWTVTVDGSTTYSYGQGTGKPSDVKDGQPVAVAGPVTGDNAMTATSVRVAGDRAAGTVTAKTADSITIKRRDGSSLTIHVRADTTYRVAGVETATLSDITVGMALGVSGRARSDGSIDAAAIIAGQLRGTDRAPGGGKFGPWLDGAMPGLAVPDQGLPGIAPLDPATGPSA
jgi:hypothetical protein